MSINESRTLICNASNMFGNSTNKYHVTISGMIIFNIQNSMCSLSTIIISKKYVFYIWVKARFSVII